VQLAILIVASLALVASLGSIGITIHYGQKVRPPPEPVVATALASRENKPDQVQVDALLKAVDTIHATVGAYRDLAYRIVLAIGGVAGGVGYVVHNSPLTTWERIVLTIALALIGGSLVWWIVRLWKSSDRHIAKAAAHWMALGIEALPETPKSWSKRMWAPILMSAIVIPVSTAGWVWSANPKEHLEQDAGLPVRVEAVVQLLGSCTPNGGRSDSGSFDGGATAVTPSSAPQPHP
jgi:hypothetical protein